MVRFSFLTSCEFGVWCDHSRVWQNSLTSISSFRHSFSIVFVSHLRQGGGNVVPKLWHHSPSHILSLSHRMDHYIISYNYYIHSTSLIPIYNFSLHKPLFAVSIIYPKTSSVWTSLQCQPIVLALMDCSPSELALQSCTCYFNLLPLSLPPFA